MAVVDELKLKEAKQAFLNNVSQKAPAIFVQMKIPLDTRNLKNMTNEQLVALYDEIVIILNERGVKF